MFEVHQSINEALHDFYAADVRVVSQNNISGGSISTATVLYLSNKEKIFCKTHAVQSLPFFQAEAHGLETLRMTAVIPVPCVIGLGTDGGRSFILLELIDGKTERNDFWEKFGHDLAKMHLVHAGNRYGFDQDNFIGAGTQPNPWTISWVDFFREHRLNHQIELALHARLINDSIYKKLKILLSRLNEFLPETDRISFLHGDLWSGNYLRGKDGYAVLIDPAVYCGHYEADLAMTELFGGFPPVFYRAYSEILPLGKEYKERKDLYNLYHMLNHLNLFGTSYLSSCTVILDHYL